MPRVTPFLAGAWRIEPAAFRITGPKGTVQIEPKVMAVLCALADRPGEVVSRACLLETVWPDAFVVEETLTRCVSELRKTFGDDARAPVAIETIRKGGYRLLLPVSDLDPVQPAEPRRAPSGAVTSWVRWSVGGVLVVVGLLGLGTVWKAASAEAPRPLQVRPLTTLPGMEFDARLSPDGQHVAFSWGGPEGSTIDLYVKRVGEEAPRRLTTSPTVEHSAAWSPDGQHLAYMQRETTGRCGLYLVPREGGPSRSIGSCGENYFGDLDWSPDGAWLAFSEPAAPDQPHRIVLLGVDTQERRLLTQPTGTPYGDYGPVFSPDGSRLAFVRMVREAHHTLFVLDLERSTPPRPLTADESILAGHSWTPDGRSLIVASWRTGRSSLWRVTVPGQAEVGAPSWIPLGLDDILAPSVARQSGRLLVAQDQSDINLWHLDLEAGTEPQRVAASTMREQAPHLSPDGQWVAFVSNRSGTSEIWTARIDGSEVKRQTHFDGGMVDAPRWSPDGARIAFDARPDGHVDLFVLDVAAGRVDRLTAEPGDERYPRWSPDGEALFFSSDREGAWSLWRMPSGGGGAERVTRGVVGEAVGGGDAVYATRIDTLGIWRVRPGQAPERLLGSLGDLDWANWAQVPDGLLFVRRDSSQARLVHYHEATRTERSLAALQGAGRGAWAVPWGQPSLTASADGQQVVFASIDRQEGDLWMVDGLAGSPRP